MKKETSEGVVIVTNKDMLKSILDDTDRLVDFLMVSPCEHCGYYSVDDGCNIDDDAYMDKDLVYACISGIKKYLDMPYCRKDS